MVPAFTPVAVKVNGVPEHTPVLGVPEMLTLTGIFGVIETAAPLE